MYVHKYRKKHSIYWVWYPWYQASTGGSRTYAPWMRGGYCALPSAFTPNPATSHHLHCYHTRQSLPPSTLAPLHTTRRIIPLKYVRSCHPFTQIPQVSPHFTKLNPKSLQRLPVFLTTCRISFPATFPLALHCPVTMASRVPLTLCASVWKAQPSPVLPRRWIPHCFKSSLECQFLKEVNAADRALNPTLPTLFFPPNTYFFLLHWLFVTSH